METSERIRILYVDDEIHNLNAFKAVFRHEFQVYTATSGFEGLKILAEMPMHVIITDQRMPEMTGIEFLVEVIRLEYPCIRILLTGYADINAVIDAINKSKIYYYLNKPWDEHQVRTIINNAYEVFSLRKANADLMEKLVDANAQLEFLLRQKLIS